MSADDVSSRECADCGALIWWNPRKRRWEHYFEPGDHEATPR